MFPLIKPQKLSSPCVCTQPPMPAWAALLVAALSATALASSDDGVASHRTAEAPSRAGLDVTAVGSVSPADDAGGTSSAPDAAAGAASRVARDALRQRAEELYAKAETLRAVRTQALAARRLGVDVSAPPALPDAAGIVQLYSEAASLAAGPGSSAAAAMLARMNEWGWDGEGDLRHFRPTSAREDDLLRTLGTWLAPVLGVGTPGAPDWLSSWLDPAATHSLVVPVDMAAAVRLYAEAARLGNASAQFTMGVLHAHGLFGVPDDDALSMLNLYWAATGGSVEAALALGHRHATGDGVPKSCASAVAYLEQPVQARARAVAESHGLLQAMPQVGGCMCV